MTFEYGLLANDGTSTSNKVPQVGSLEIVILPDNKITIKFVTIPGGNPKTIIEQFDKVTHLALSKT